MDIFCCQFDIAWESPTRNFHEIEAALGEVHVPSGSLLVFPELAAVGFSMNVAAIAEESNGPASSFFSGLARRFGSHVLAGIPGLNPENGLGWNEAVCYAPDGSEKARYRKNRLFPLADEGSHYEAGTDGVLFDCEGWKVAPFICYDLRFPELFRAAARQGADCFAVIANWPAAREDHWTTLLRARAIENQAYVIGVNRCGSDPNLEYCGASLIVGPTGETLAEAGAGPKVLHTVLDRDALDDWRARFPALADLKPD